ncbi:hypothetical protein HDU86_005992 [Geranomyces michiganensis]|nr:hypothetical protein HDU86_005992 [Geranomyces michiganensis]
MASQPGSSSGEFAAGGGGDNSAYGMHQHEHDPAYADPTAAAAAAYTEYDYQQWQAYQEAQQQAVAWAGGVADAEYWAADWQQQQQQQQQQPPPSLSASSYAAAPVQYSAPPSATSPSAKPNSTTTYGAPATYYAAPSQTSQSAATAAAPFTALPARPPPLAARDDTSTAGGGVPYPSGYTVDSESGAVPYPAGYTPSAATATVVRVRSDEDRKAAALAALPPTPAVPPPQQPQMMTYQPTPAAGIAPAGAAGIAGPAVGTAADSKGRPKKPVLRTAGGEAWEDPTLAEWDSKDYRLFCGDLGNEVTDELLLKAFAKYPSVLRARVVRNSRSNKSKGYGFVSFKDPSEFTAAMREMNGKYVGNRPIKLRKSTWAERTVDAKTLRKIQQTAIFKPVLKTVTKKEPKKDPAAAAAAAAALGHSGGAGMDQYGYGHQQQYPPQGGFYGQ